MEGVKIGPVPFVELCFSLLLHQDLAGLEALQELFDIIRLALAAEELSRGDVEEGDATSLLVQVNGTEEIVAPGLKHLVIEGDSRGHELRHPPLYDLLGKLGVFQLVADGDTEPGFYQFGQIGVEGMMRETGQRGLAFRPGTSLGEDDSQDPGRLLGVVPEGLIKITHAKQEHRIGILRLDAVVLLHQGCDFL